MIDFANHEYVLAATLVGEAAGEGEIGEEDVATVVMNRVAIARRRPRRQFGDGTVAGACLAPAQFSCWFRAPTGSRERLVALDFGDPDANLALALDVARRAIAGAMADPTGGALTNPDAPATFYKRTDCPWPKDWGPEVPPLWTYRHHHFFHLP